MTITLLADKGSELLPTEADENIRDLATRTQEGWKDLVSPLQPIGVPSGNQPAVLPFWPSWLRKEFAFDVEDYLFAKPFHVNHDVKLWGKTLIHIHWSTNWVATESVKWEFQITQAKWHDQEFFWAAISYFVESQPNQVAIGAWRHYVTEVPIAEALVWLEPDTIVMVTVKRVTNWVVDNTDQVFWFSVDFHYEADRDSTPNRAPNFYTP